MDIAGQENHDQRHNKYHRFEQRCGCAVHRLTSGKDINLGGSHALLDAVAVEPVTAGRAGGKAEGARAAREAVKTHVASVLPRHQLCLVHRTLENTVSKRAGCSCLPYPEPHRATSPASSRAGETMALAASTQEGVSFQSMIMSHLAAIEAASRGSSTGNHLSRVDTLLLALGSTGASLPAAAAIAISAARLT